MIPTGDSNSKGLVRGRGARGGEDMCPEGKGNKFLSLLPFRPEKVSKVCPPTEEQAWYQPVKLKGNMLYLLPKMSTELPEITEQGEKLKEPAEFDKSLAEVYVTC